MAQGALPVIIPEIRDAFNLSYFAVGILVMVSNISSSVIQPLFGLWSDLRSSDWLLPVGCLLSLVGIGLAGISPHYALVLLAVLMSGLGVAAYHPEASKTARFLSGHRKASSMAVFSVGGNLGFGLGPLLGTVFLTWAGLRGSMLFLLIGLPMSFFLWRSLPVIRERMNQQQVPANAQETTEGKGEGSASLEDTGKGKSLLPLILLLLYVIARSWIHFGLVTYIPFYYQDYLHGDPAKGGYVLSAFLIAGAVGTLVGGPLADAVGGRRVIIGSMVMIGPLIFAFLHSSGFWAYVVVSLLGAVIVSTFAITVVLGQELLPNHVGVASGLMLGFAIGTGGIGVTLLGWIADHFGIIVTIKAIGLLSLVGIATSLPLNFWGKGKTIAGQPVKASKIQ